MRRCVEFINTQVRRQLKESFHRNDHTEGDQRRDDGIGRAEDQLEQRRVERCCPLKVDAKDGHRHTDEDKQQRAKDLCAALDVRRRVGSQHAGDQHHETCRMVMAAYAGKR